MWEPEISQCSMRLVPNRSLYLNYLLTAVRLCILKRFVFASFYSVECFTAFVYHWQQTFMLCIWCRRLFYTFVIKWEFSIWTTLFWRCVLKVIIFSHQILTLLLRVWLASLCYDDRLVCHYVYKMCATTIFTFFTDLAYHVALNFLRIACFKMSRWCRVWQFRKLVPW